MLAREQWWIGLPSAEQEPRDLSKYSMYGIAHRADPWVELVPGKCAEAPIRR